MVTDGSSNFLPPKQTNLAAMVADFTRLLGQSLTPGFGWPSGPWAQVTKCLQILDKDRERSRGKKVIVIIFP